MQSSCKCPSGNNRVQPNFVAGNHCVKSVRIRSFSGPIFPHSEKFTHFHENWKKTTNDHIILSIIQYALKIKFIEKPNYQNFPKLAHDILETDKIPQKVKRFLRKGVIAECFRELGDFLSTAFVPQKKDDLFRTILNLKYVNEFVQ